MTTHDAGQPGDKQFASPADPGPATTTSGVRSIAPHHRGRWAVPAPQLPGPLWHPASGRFDPVALRAALVSRGWTVGEFAEAARVSRACLYNALRGFAVSDRTVIRIVAALETRSPASLLSAL